MGRLTLLCLLFAILLLTSAKDCAKEDAATQKFWCHIVQPIIDNPANVTEMDYRVELQAALEGLYNTAKLKDDTFILGYYQFREDDEFGIWVINQGGYKWVAPRVLCFSRHYRESARKLFKTRKCGSCACSPTKIVAVELDKKAVLEAPAPVLVAPKPQIEEVEIEVPKDEEPVIVVPGQG